MSDVAGTTARRAYRSAPLTVRVHVAGRWWTCPFGPIADALTGADRVLDVGCGHGLFPLYLGIRHGASEIVGVEIDREKLIVARAAALSAGLASRVSFEEVGPGYTPAEEPPVRPTEGWDGISVVDVLYLMGPERAMRLLRAAAKALAPGGKLVVKEIDTTPAWKHRISAVQEVVATRVLRITQGDHNQQVASSTVVAELTSAGLDVTTVRLDRGRIHPDYLVVGTRP
ncbi:MAG: class I SAM-dependent methyltransferase [Acidimicrobiia bacterium]|nr:class I SAM-dependent methyltransferase [Acidimicrobiia bacterium]